MKNKFDRISEDSFMGVDDNPYLLQNPPTPLNPDYVPPAPEWHSPMPAPATSATPKKGISQDTINAGIGAGEELLGLFMSRPKNPQKQTIKAACGHKPFCMLTANCKKKKAAYQKCAQDTIAPPPPPVDYSAKSQSSSSNTGLIIGISIAGVVVLGVIGFVVIKRMNKPAVSNTIAQNIE